MKKLALLLMFFPTLAWPVDLVRLEKRATYSASSGAVTPPATPSDICKISGSASKTVYVQRLELTSTQTTAGYNVFFLAKRSTDNTGGTLTSLVRVPFDSNSGAAGASTVSYTGNPTTGAVVGNIKALHLFSPAPGSVAGTPGYMWDFDRDNSGQPIVLRGTGEVLAVNFAGAALPTGLSVTCNFTWSEE